MRHLEIHHVNGSLLNLLRIPEIVEFPIDSMLDLSIVFCDSLPEGKNGDLNGIPGYSGVYIYMCNQLKMIWVCLKMAYTPSHVDREHDAINNGNWGYAAFSDKPLWMVHYWIRSPGKSSHFTSLRTITNETLVFTSKTPAKMWILSLPLIYSPTWFSNGLISVPSQLKPPDQPLLNEYRKKTGWWLTYPSEK